MRTVRRRFTDTPPPVEPFQQPRAPWTWRGEATTGAPRTLMSNHRDSVHVRRGNTVLRVGTLDWMLRLYQHFGVSERDVRQEECIVYDVEEWQHAMSVAEWIEFVDLRRERVLRTDKRKAIMAKRSLKDGDHYRFAVPVSVFEVHERD